MLDTGPLKQISCLPGEHVCFQDTTAASSCTAGLDSNPKVYLESLKESEEFCSEKIVESLCFSVYFVFNRMLLFIVAGLEETEKRIKWVN